MSAYFADVAAAAERVRATRSKLAKMAALAELFAELDDEDLAHAARLLAGAPFARSDERVLGLGWSTVVDALLELSGADGAELSESYQRFADLGDVAEDLFTRHGRAREGAPLALSEVPATFAEMAATRGARARRALLAALLRRADPLEAKYLVKLVTGEMRIGLREGLLEDAIARATERQLAEVSWANMLEGDIGATAVRARRGALAEARLHLFRPLGFMLATAVLELGEVARRFPPPYLVEDKYDGVRVQVHREGDRLAMYSRTLDEVTHRFPELHAPLLSLPGSFVLDAEVVGLGDGRAIPFVRFQRRLGRKTIGADLLRELPAALFAFDLLARDGEPLLDRPLLERRALLLELPLTAPLSLARAQVVEAEAEELPARLDALFLAARERGNEGLMVKDLRSRYRPGRRGMEWLKVKRALETLDVVVTGVEWGHGKRRDVLSDYTFAVRDGERLVEIGKAYSGLTDAEIARLTRHFLDQTVEEHGRFRRVVPDVVIEVAFDSAQQSDRHPSGYALRFPRIVRLRPDKPPSEADTLDAVRERARDIGRLAR